MRDDHTIEQAYEIPARDFGTEIVGDRADGGYFIRSGGLASSYQRNPEMFGSLDEGGEQKAIERVIQQMASTDPEPILVRITIYPGPVPPKVVPLVVARLNQILTPTFEGTAVAEPHEDTIRVDGTARWDNRTDVLGQCVFAFWEPAEEYSDIHLHM